METTRAPDWPPWLVIAWLAGPQGQKWSRDRVSRSLERHWENSGVFGEVISQEYFWRSEARWPEPPAASDLDLPGHDPGLARALG